jgi:hypothetical protein
MTRRILLAIVLVTLAIPAAAQTTQVHVDPAQQAFVAGFLRWLGQAMIDNANEWAGVVLLAVPPLSGLIGWLMPREWLFALIKGTAAPLLAIGKLIISSTSKKGA